MQGAWNIEVILYPMQQVPYTVVSFLLFFTNNDKFKHF